MAKSQIFYGILTTSYVLWNPDHRLDDAVQSVLEYPVGLPDVFEWEHEMQYGVAVAAVDPAGLEGEVFAIHFRQGENLGGIIHCNNSDNGIWSGAFPCHSECFIASGSLNHPVCPSMGAVTQDKLPAFFRGSHQYIRIVLSYEIGPVGVLFADYNPFWLISDILAAQ